MANCNTPDEPRVGTVQQANETPPPKPTYPDNVILPTEAVGYLPGAGSVSAAGQADYVIPLDVPPGRLGMQPELSLRYTSGAEEGVVGVGWGVSGIPVIARCNRTHASDDVADGVDWDDSDAFCLNGQKLVGGTFSQSDNTIVYRTAVETFDEVRAHLWGGSAGSPSKFVVRARDGRILEFLPMYAERVDVDPLDPANVTSTTVRVVWPVQEIRDRSGNSIHFAYEPHYEATFPYSFWYVPGAIRYTFSSTAPGTPAEREVRFEYEDRLPMDQPFQYSAGVRTVLAKRLKAIEMYAPPKPGEPKALGWRYQLDYALSDSTFRSLLQSVKQCDPLGKCKWAKELTWSSEQDAGDLNQVGLVSTLVDDSVQAKLPVIGGDGSHFRQPPGGVVGSANGTEGAIPVGGFPGVLVGDFDHDGRDDALYWDDWKTTDDPEGPELGKHTRYLKLRLSKTDPLSQEHEVGLAVKSWADNLSGPDPQADDFKFIGLNLGASRVVDLDGDGDQELFLARQPFESLERSMRCMNGTTAQEPSCPSRRSKCGTRERTPSSWTSTAMASSTSSGPRATSGAFGSTTEESSDPPR